MLLVVIFAVVAYAFIKAGLVWVVVVAAAGLFGGLRAGRAWGLNQLATFERRERMRRARSKQGGWGIF